MKEVLCTGCDKPLPFELVRKGRRCHDDMCKRMSLAKAQKKHRWKAPVCVPRSLELWIDDVAPLGRSLHFPER